MTNTNLICLLWQMNQREMQVKNRVCAVALTDSAHNIWLQETSKGTQDWMQQVKTHTHTDSNTQTRTEGKQKTLQTIQASIPELPSHHVNSPGGELRSLSLCSSLIPPRTTPLTYTGTPDQELPLEVIENHCLHVFPRCLFSTKKKSAPTFFFVGACQ